MAREKLKAGMLYTKMKEIGFENITEFVKTHPELELSFETIRRAILQDSQTIEYIVIAELMQALDFTPQEISVELQRRGDHVIHRLISDSVEGMILSSREKRIINLSRAYGSSKVYNAIEAIFALVKGQEKPMQEGPAAPEAGDVK